MKPRRFKGSIEKSGNRAIITIPFDPDEAWGPKDRHYITGSVNGQEPEGPQSGELSPDVSAALEAEPEAQAFFDSLASFYRYNFIRSIESAKRPETRAARIAKMMEALKSGQRAI